MKYRDLIQFEPVQTVKVLADADNVDQAREDVRTFVISHSMHEQLRDIIGPQLNFNSPKEDKGLLIVANYGTGKTHLMSVLSAVAEHKDLLGLLTKEETQEALAPIAGRFKVIRAEIGAVTMSLRDIVITELETGLASMGVEFTFPSMADVSNNKDSIQAMMAKFEESYPEQGLLFVLDELLDYLRSLKDAEMILALRFLREIGEICRDTRFRFIGGVQEAIFDNPRFANVADAVQRVKDRFEQVRISREDVAYVVQERLLKKNAAQRQQITDYLQPFTPLYEGMSEGLTRFVELFPVHPAYLRVFEQVSAIEKREILKTLSREMERLLDEDIPGERAGLITYDSYRARLDAEPSFRQIPEVREVLETNSVLRSRIEQALPTKAYVSTALQIIDALTIQRLTTGDIYVPVGVTRRELRDDLCLLPPNLPVQDAFFLETTVDSIIEQIMKAVSGQFISEDPDTHQVYLDVRKTVDYDQQINDRAASLDADKLDEGYFHALEEVLERRDMPYVSGYRIWEYELAWTDRSVTRFGYLFMGAPNERSTAQPPRDFYIYFLQPYDPPKFKDEQKSDEVFFRLESPDDEFTATLRRYAGANAKSVETAGEGRAIYESKARESLQKMVTWLKKHMGEAISVTHAGTKQSLQAWLGASRGPRSSIKEQVDSIASQALAGHFTARYPGYPKFDASITRDNIHESAKQALTHLATTRKTELSSRILRSLELLDNSGNVVAAGEFAEALIAKITGANGQVVNRADLLQERDPSIWTWGDWHLEPIWLVVVAAALTNLGKAELGFPGRQVDALGLQQLTSMSLADLESFSHVAPPKELPVTQLRGVAKLLGLPPGIVADVGVNAEAVQQILTAANALLTRTVEARGVIQGGLQLWGGALLEQPDERDARLGSLQTLLEDLRARDSIGKMNKLNVGTEAIDQAAPGIAEVAAVESLRDARGHLGDVVEYLREAGEIFGQESPLSAESSALREEMLSALRGNGIPDPAAISTMKAQAEDLRRRFASEAAKAHARDRLDGQGDERKRAILEGPTYRTLGVLQVVSILPQGSFGSLQDRLARIQTCKTFDEAAMFKSVICAECAYRPRPAPGPTAKAAIEDIERDVDRLLGEWVRTLAENLGAQEMQNQIDLLAEVDKEMVAAFAASKELPADVSDNFVKALDSVFKRFEVRRVTPGQVWGRLFPEQAPATAEELQERFGSFVSELTKGVSGERLRVVPAEDEEPS